MPFTFSHPALVLPLISFSKRWFSITGLVIGSMIPDFEYFLRMSIRSEYSHTIFGILYFDLPLGIILAFLFHNIVRNRLFDNLPWLKSRFNVFKTFSWNNYFKQNWLIVICSILIGAASHLLWDSFTHPTGYWVQQFPALSETVLVADYSVLWFKILQHASTLLGGIIILIAIIKLPQNEPKNTTIDWKYWLSITLISLLVIAMRFYKEVDIKIGNLIVSTISAIFIAMITTPFIVKEETDC